MECKIDIAFHTASDLAKYKEEIISLLYRKYEEEMKHFLFLNFMSKDKFQSYTDQRLTYMIGIIESNGKENSFVCAGDKSVNVGEVYVLPEYRRFGLAQDLLFYAEKSVLEQGAAFMWVEHGTANPNARGFWNRYFDTYQYEMIRQVVW